MNQVESTQLIADPLKKKIDEKIAAIRSVEKNFPGAIIIHNITDSSIVYMSEWGRNYLGITMTQIREMGAEFQHLFFNI